MVYGTGFAVADDVVAHELGHGVTQNTAGLIYWFQSGAINESMSDVIGELVDLADATGNDAPEVRWLLGEDLSPRAGGVARDMADPTAFGQPDHTASTLYDFAPDYDDNGGVHTNSGVPNKTAYLVVDGTAGEPGGAFNGAAFPGIGPDKAALALLDRAAVADPGGRLRRPRRRPPAVLHQPRGDRGGGHRRCRLRLGAGRGRRPPASPAGPGRRSRARCR